MINGRKLVLKVIEQVPSIEIHPLRLPDGRVHIVLNISLTEESWINLQTYALEDPPEEQA